MRANGAARRVADNGERSPSWLAVLRFTSVEHLPIAGQPPGSKQKSYWRQSLKFDASNGKFALTGLISIPPLR